jgi:hypothetical protein
MTPNPKPPSLTDEERRIIGEADHLRLLLQGPGGQKVLDVLMQGLDQLMLEMSDENRKHAAEWYVGGVAALQNSIRQIFGTVSWAERVVRKLQERTAARAEVKRGRKPSPYSRREAQEAI